MKLALGTVQFGLTYGVMNQTGKPSEEMVSRILRRAHCAGIDTLDTAIAYGEAERVLGDTEGGTSDLAWRTISKLPPLPSDLKADEVAGWVSKHVHACLGRLQTNSLDGLLLHRSVDLLGSVGRELASSLKREKLEGRTRSVGVSIYAPEDLDDIHRVPWSAEGLPLDIVQSPYNALDRRLTQSGWAPRLADAGCEIHIRSAFLQGLLLAPAGPRTATFDMVRDQRGRQPLVLWREWLAQTGRDPLEASLSAVLHDPCFAKVVVGVESLGQLDDILVAAGRAGSAPPDELATDQAMLLDPRQWS